MRAHVILWRALAHLSKPSSQYSSLSAADCRTFTSSPLLQADSGTEGPPKQKLSALPFRVHPSNTSRQPLMANVLGAVDGVAAVFVCAMLTNIQCMQLSQADASAAFDKYHSGNFFLTQPSAGDPAATISSYA